MIQLVILNGREAGRHCLARRFPFQLGRSSAAQLVLEGDGVWDRHATIQFRPGEGLLLEANPGAIVSVNGQKIEQVLLRNGDHLECGSAKLRFWLAPSRQRSLRPREALTWLGLAALVASELALAYLLAA